MMVEVFITHIEKQTEKAALVGLDNGKTVDKVWVAKANVKKIFGQVDAQGNKYNLSIVVPKWVASQMGVFAKCWDGTNVYGWKYYDKEL